MSEALYGSFKDFIFKKAVKFLRGRKALPKDVYMKLDDEARAKAFTVSGYTALEVLQEFSDALADAVEQGKTKDDFLKEMNTFLADRGYEAMNPWKSDTIFRTNIQTAYNAGHFQSMTSPETLRLRPYWQYKTAADGRVRESHAIMHDAVYRADDPVWDILCTDGRDQDCKRHPEGWIRGSWSLFTVALCNTVRRTVRPVRSILQSRVRASSWHLQHHCWSKLGK